MAHVRTVMSFLVGGALAGILLSSLIGPRYIQWDSTSSANNAMCLCAETARQGADRMIAFQMNGCGLGALAGVVLGGVFVVLKRRRAAAMPPPAAPPAG